MEPPRTSPLPLQPVLGYALGVLVLLLGPYVPLGELLAVGGHRHHARSPAPGCAPLPGVDIALVVATTEARVHEVAARHTAPRNAAARLFIAHGGSGSGGGAEEAEDVTTCALLRERVSVVRASACTEEPAAPPWSVAHHPFSSLTCRAMEGLCAAVEAGGTPPPALYAVVSEDSRFRWPRFLRQQRARAAAAPYVLTDVLEGWGWGLPKHLKKPAWPRMPGFNATLVLTGDVAATLCALHRAAPLQLIGPPELFFGFLLSTLDRVPWYSQAQAKAAPLAEQCPAGVFALGLDEAAWAACEGEGEGEDAAPGEEEEVRELSVWPYPGPL